MNTLTQQQINQYQWQVADGVAKPVNPNEALDFLSGGQMYTPQPYVDFFLWAEDIEYFTNAPDSIYSGESFEEPVWQGLTQIKGKDYGDWFYLTFNSEAMNVGEWQQQGYKTRQFLRLKPSHLPVVLTTQPGEEWKDRYKEVWYVQERGNLDWTKVTRRAIYDNYTFERYAALQFDKQDQATKREWHLITPHAENKINSKNTEIRNQAHEMWAEGAEDFQVSKESAFGYLQTRGYTGSNFDCTYDTMQYVWRWSADIKPLTPPAEQEAETVDNNGTIEPVIDCGAGARSAALWLDDYCNKSLPYHNMVSDAARKAANHIQNLQSTLTQKEQRIAELEREWISVDDRLPDEDEWINIYWDDKICYEYRYYPKMRKTIKFSHWMPVINPPQH